MTPLPLLRVRGVTMTFPGLRALDDVSLELAAGEVMALVGQNGSGKSTLVKVLTGLYEPDPGGTVEVRGPGGELVTGNAAHRELRVIHQDLGLVGSLSTVENLDLGRQHGHRGWLPFPRRAEQRHAQELVARFGADFDVTRPLGELTPAERAIVAIARALDAWDRPDHVLVLDEPTAALHGAEVGKLFTAIRRVAAGGAGVIFISHRLDEVGELADRVVAIRDGQIVADVPAGDVDHSRLVAMITGRQVAEHRHAHRARRGDPVLRVRGLAGTSLKGVDLDVHRGEILGISGLLGSGREHVCGSIFGARTREGGTISVNGRELAVGRPLASIAADVAYVPGDRHAEGAVMGMNARENLTLPRLGPLTRSLGHLDVEAERTDARDWAGRVGLAPADPERELSLFSGGNQQKVVLAKWLRIGPCVLLLDEPTQGVDVGAKAAIYELIEQAAHDGSAVVVASSDEKELALLCDRVAVLRGGHLAATLEGHEVDEARLVLEGLGLRRDEAGALFGDQAGGPE